MNGDQRYMTLCCNFIFEFMINSPIRDKGDHQECVNCGHIFKTDEAKIIVMSEVEGIPQ